MVICLKRGADLHMAQLMSLPLTVSCFSKIQTGFPFLVLAYLGSSGKRAIKRVCVCVCVHLNSIHTERFDCSYKHLLGGRLTAVRSAVVEFCHPGSTETRPQRRQQHLVN